jgi:hypothetical protein
MRFSEPSAHGGPMGKGKVRSDRAIWPRPGERDPACGVMPAGDCLPGHVKTPVNMLLRPAGHDPAQGHCFTNWIGTEKDR